MIVEAEAGGDAFDGDMTGSVVGARFCNGGHVKDHVCNCGIWLDRFEAFLLPSLHRLRHFDFHNCSIR